MMTKKVTVILRRLPLESEKAAEALRVSVGYTLAKAAVTVVFIDDGVWAATPLHPAAVRGPEFAKHIETLQTLGHTLLADEESLRARGIEAVREGIGIKP